MVNVSSRPSPPFRQKMAQTDSRLGAMNRTNFLNENKDILRPEIKECILRYVFSVSVKRLVMTEPTEAQRAAAETHCGFAPSHTPFFSLKTDIVNSSRAWRALSLNFLRVVRLNVNHLH
jgi:hypothetical protein